MGVLLLYEETFAIFGKYEVHSLCSKTGAESFGDGGHTRISLERSRGAGYTPICSWLAHNASLF